MRPNTRSRQEGNSEANLIFKAIGTRKTKKMRDRKGLVLKFLKRNDQLGWCEIIMLVEPKFALDLLHAYLPVGFCSWFVVGIYL